jgi:hypothetical protein
MRPLHQRRFRRQRGWLIARVSIAPEFVMQMDDTFERPGGGLLCCWRGHAAAASLQLGENRLNVGAQLLQTRRVRLQLLHRFLMHQPQRMSFSIDRFFECADAVIDVSARRRVLLRLPLMEGEAESIQLGFEAR